jgi:hypothetical protein
MSATIFLDPIRSDLRTVFLQIRNTSDQSAFDVANEVREGISAKGYRVVDDPQVAQYILQINVLQVGKSSPSAAQQVFGMGYGGAAAGAGVATLAAYSAGMNSGRGLAAAGLFGGIAESVTGAIVKDVYFSAITDVQIKERSGERKVQATAEHNLRQGTSGGTRTYISEETDWKTYQTRILSSANKVNLEFAEAAPVLRAGLARAVAGLF